MNLLDILHLPQKPVVPDILICKGVKFYTSGKAPESIDGAPVSRDAALVVLNAFLVNNPSVDSQALIALLLPGAPE